MMMVNVMSKGAATGIGNKLVGIHDGAKFSMVLVISKKGRLEIADWGLEKRWAKWCDCRSRGWKRQLHTTWVY